MKTPFGMHARRTKEKQRTQRPWATRRPRFETLERRDLLAATLHADSISVTPGAIVGEQSSLTARFKSTDLVAGGQVNVQLLFNGQVLQTITRTAIAGVDVPYVATVSWFARPGQIELRLDTENAIAEADETDNVATLNYTPAAPILPNKYVFPVGGDLFRDWFIFGSVDVDPRTGEHADFRGEIYASDGHDAWDIGLSKRLPAMDKGVPTFAIADGMVTQTHDGDFDRETTSPDIVGNHVVVDHGGGFTADYWHLAANTITVKVGDRIQAGQVLGYVGSSGTSRAAHLHFGLYHNGRIVETAFSPDLFWTQPPAYTFDLPTTVLDSAITNYLFPPAILDRANPSDAKEAPSEIRVFPTTSEWSVSYWVWALPNHRGDTVQVRWVRPDGAVEKIQDLVPATQESDERAIANLQSLEHARWSPYPGTWHVAMVVNGREIDRQSFEVTTGPGVPEIRVTQGSTYIIDGRTTPIDFGTASATTPRALTFTIQNHGSAELTTSGLELPPGFSLVGQFPTSVPPATTASFQVQLDTAVPGQKFGQIRFRTNDADEGDFNFNVKGNVGGTIPVGTPRINLPGPAVAYINSTEPRLIAATGSVTDSDSISFNTGQLKVEFASGGTHDDRLAIRNQGTAAGEIGVHAGSVTYGGVVIGNFSGGRSETPLMITFNASANLEAVQALVRNLTFANVSREPATNHRYVRLTLMDDTGKTSNMAIAHVLVDPRPAPVPPALPGDYNQDRIVDAADYAVWRNAMGRSASKYGGADGSGNGIVDQDDYGVWRAHFGQTLPAPADAARAVQAVNSFAIDLYEQLQHEEGNLFFSPLSISTALAMAYVGAAGQTAAEMEQVLNLGSEAGIHESFAALVSSLTDPAALAADGFQLELANAMWPQIGFPIREEFIHTIETDYRGATQSLDYSDPEKARQIINSWAEDKTHGKVKELFKRLSENTRMVLTNSIYFKAGWSIAFDPTLTDTPDARVFHRENGEPVSTSMMYTQMVLPSYGLLDGFQVLEMPLEGGRTSMVLALPEDPATTPNELTRELFVKIDDWLESPRELATLEVILPKFSTSVGTQLEDLLAEMGMPSAFSNADFSKMTPAGVWIDQVRHKAFFEMNEQGTEASAVTGVNFQACFAAGTPVLTPEGEKSIDEIKAGDYVLARNELDVEGNIEPKRVEATFQGQKEVVHLHVRGQVIRPTKEHPFYVMGRGWTPAGDLRAGDLLATNLGKWFEVEQVVAAGERVPIYNFLVADHHTYFIGGKSWGFAVWTHNGCGPGFRATRPFQFFIRDNATDALLFMGRIDDPSQSSNELEPSFDSSPAPIQADPNGDGPVNRFDPGALASALADPSTYNTRQYYWIDHLNMSDINHDGALSSSAIATKRTILQLSALTPNSARAVAPRPTYPAIGLTARPVDEALAGPYKRRSSLRAELSGDLISLLAENHQPSANSSLQGASNAPQQN
jgi:serpin B